MKATISLNASGIIYWMVFIHNKNYTTLDYSKAYGGQYLSFYTGWTSSGKKVVSTATLSLELDIVEYLDVEENNCPPLPDTNKDFDLDRCLAQYYADKLGCLCPWESSSVIAQFPTCDTASQYRGK